MNLERVGVSAAKTLMIKALSAKASLYGYKSLADMGISGAAARDLKLNQVPSMTMEKMIVALRLMGHAVTITVDGVELPVGEPSAAQ